jgi:hypothetical protein
LSGILVGSVVFGLLVSMESTALISRFSTQQAMDCEQGGLGHPSFVKNEQEAFENVKISRSASAHPDYKNRPVKLPGKKKPMD